MIGKSHYLDAQAVRTNPVDLVVTHAEINHRHGVGVLLGRLLGSSRELMAIRSRETFGGETSLAGRTARLAHGTERGDGVYRNVLRALGEFTVRRILCVPYYPDDVKTAIAAKEIYDAPMCTFLMDDQKHFRPRIDDVLMKSYWKNRLCAWRYLRSYVMPTKPSTCFPFGICLRSVPDALIPSQLVLPNGVDSGNPVMIGNVWGEQMAEAASA